MFTLKITFEKAVDAQVAKRFVLDSTKTSGNVMRVAKSAVIEGPACRHGEPAGCDLCSLCDNSGVA